MGNGAASLQAALPVQAWHTSLEDGHPLRALAREHLRCDDGQTWEWDGVVWTPRTPANSPVSRTGHAMAYDAGRNRVVLFGGATVAPTTALGDTWEWDGAAWSQATPAHAPAARHAHRMAYDAARGRSVLFGGDRLGALVGDGRGHVPWRVHHILRQRVLFIEQQARVRGDLLHASAPIGAL